MVLFSEKEKNTKYSQLFKSFLCFHHTINIGVFAKRYSNFFKKHLTNKFWCAIIPLVIKAMTKTVD